MDATEDGVLPGPLRLWFISFPWEGSIRGLPEEQFHEGWWVEPEAGM